MIGVARGPFTRKRGGILVRLGDAERELMSRLLDDVAELLKEPEPGSAGGADLSAHPDSDPWAMFEQAMQVQTPADPAVARLLPDGSRDDGEVAAGYRRLTEGDLRSSKRETAAIAAAALRRPGPVQLSHAEALALIKGMTDVRLVVAERLGLHTDEDAARLGPWLRSLGDDSELSEQERSDASLATIYEALTWWQESLVGALGRGAR